MNNKTIKRLKDWAKLYECPAFIEGDPIQFPRRYTDQRDIEISAFVTSWISFGNRKQIIKKAEYIDRELFKGKPYQYIMNMEWQMFFESPIPFYRMLTDGDFFDMCHELHNMYETYGTMQNYIAEFGDIFGVNPLVCIKAFFNDTNIFIPSLNSQSACKRLCMFLRWMCRKNSPVDIGCWDFDQKDLIIPLDTHVHKMAIELGITSRKTADMKTAVEITNFFKKLFPKDPCKGDFALFGYGINHI